MLFEKKLARRTVTLEHKVSLKRRLSKAFKKAGIDADPPKAYAAEPFAEDGSDGAARVPVDRDASGRSAAKKARPDDAKSPTATGSRASSSRQPYRRADPLKLVVQQREKQRAEEERLRQEREQEITKRLEARQASIKKREKIHAQMTRRTRKGQPVLSRQIDNLLGKIVQGQKQA